jgi:hypothetical protein
VLNEAWVQRRLRFDLPAGCRLDGGTVGGNWVVLKLVYPDGRAWAVRIPREPFLFPSYIDEIPNWLAPSPQYDVERLNLKLAGLLGDPNVHLLVPAYDTLFRSFVLSLHEDGVSDVDRIEGETDADTTALRFILLTPAVLYRLEELGGDSTDTERRAWADKTKRAMARLRADGNDLRPEHLLDNPLFVWGGAVAAGFFTKQELGDAATGATAQLEAISDELIETFLTQTVVLVNALRGVVGHASRIPAFCDATGLLPWQLATEEERAAPDEFLTWFDAVSPD